MPQASLHPTPLRPPSPSSEVEGDGPTPRLAQVRFKLDSLAECPQHPPLPCGVAEQPHGHWQVFQIFAKIAFSRQTKTIPGFPFYLDFPTTVAHQEQRLAEEQSPELP